jgi:hypothetical protein
MKRSLLLIALAASLSAAEALSYEELLMASISADPRIERLSIAEERARIALDRAVLSKDSPSLEARTGEIAASLSSSGASLSGSPGAGYSLPGGAAIGLEIPFSASKESAYARPGLSADIPILRGPDSALLAARRARAAYVEARRSRAIAELELEGEIAAALKKVLDARAAAAKAAREEAGARRDLERAVSVDGASPGGTAYMALERALRSAARARRDARAAEAAALSGLGSAAGEAALGDGTSLPESFPEPDMTIRLPAPADCRAAVRAREEAALARLEADMAERRTTLSAQLGAAYGLGDDPGGKGLGLSAGVRAAVGRSGLEAAAGLGWSAGAGPGVKLSLSWKGAPRGEEALRSRDAELAERERELAAARAERDAAEAVEALERRRTSLAESKRDAEEDLAAAEEQLGAYSAWRERGLVGDAEYAEVMAARDECRSRAGSAVLERIAWSVEARLLSAGDIGGGR